MRKLFPVLASDHPPARYYKSSSGLHFKEIGLRPKEYASAQASGIHSQASMTQGNSTCQGFKTSQSDNNLNLHLFGDFED